MEPERDEIHVGTDASRAGSTPYIVRWILGISLFLAAAAMTIIWVTGALTQNEAERNAKVTATKQPDASIILSEDADRIRGAPDLDDTKDQPLSTVKN